MALGNFVKDERRKLGLTQQELANKASVGLNFVYQLEKNKETVRLDCLNQVIRALGFELSVKRNFDPWTATSL